MTNLWRGAALAALVSGALAGCASPQYPIEAGQAPGPAPLSAPTPRYPITASSQAPAPVVATAAPTPDAPSEPTPMAAPVSKVESHSLPALEPAAPFASQVGAPTAADAPDATLSPTPTPPTPAPSPTPDASTPQPTPAPVASPPLTPPPAEPALTPRMVVHDQATSVVAAPVVHDAGPPVRDTVAGPPPVVRRGPDRDTAIGGQVIDAGDSILENYEVQKGDHIDALARAFSTSRDAILGANHLRAPYLLHPGQILKVPVAKAYVAESGDTLAGIARRFSVEVGELADLNHISSRTALRAGQHIGLPSSMRDRGPLRGYAAPQSDYAQATPRPSPPPTPSPSYGYVAHPGLTPLNPNGGVSVSRGPGYANSPPPPPLAQVPVLSDAQVSAAAKGRFVWPVRGDIVARFGPMGVGRRNDGVDIRAAQGSAVKAAAPGEVVYAGDQVPGFGNLVLIKHADGWVTAYAHLDQVNVQMKDEVTQGQQVGSVGMSGGATEPELHFEVRYAPTPADKARPVDPVLVLPSS